jgi:FtsP/CotA-like multicopper oxidase with cupredoxin domain
MTMADPAPVGSRSRQIGAAALLCILLVALGIVYVSLPAAPLPVQAQSFTIIADSNGFNESVQHGLPWPVISVHVGENVTIIVLNEDRLETHGFAIVGYFDKGLIVGPGENDSVSFTARTAGNFTMYCNIFCTVHEFMVGELMVEA